jgi:phage FluMu protein Com
MMPIRPRGGVSPRSSRQAVAEAPLSRVVPKPVPERESKDARGYQIEQLRRRFSPKETDLGHGDLSLLFNLAPSDPDFPFDLAHLECDLRVPEGYPKKPPHLQVKNKDIPRGFTINIEKGWDALVQEKRGATLLSLTNALDRRLESLLSEQKAETVKLTIFKDTRHLDAESVTEPTAQPAKPVPKPPVSRPYIPEESYSKDQIAEAKARRAQDVRQLEARMSRLPVYLKSSDGIIYTLSLEPKRRAGLPVGLQQIQSVQLIIPLLYPLQPLRVLLNDVNSEDAEPIEELFAQKAAEQKQMSLTSHLNYLAQNLLTLAKQAQKPLVEAAPAPEMPNSADLEAGEAEHTSTLDKGKGHVHVIPRPPEWAFDDDTDSSEDDSYDDDDEDGGAAVEPDHSGPSLPTQTPERGTAMSFPSIELHGIELLQVSILNLNVKCDRCKTLNEITGLKDNLEKASSCKKCATLFTLRFRQELIHQHSTRAGFIDATGCTVADLLPR